MSRRAGTDEKKVVLQNVGAQPLQVLEVSGTAARFRMEDSFDSG